MEAKPTEHEQKGWTPRHYEKMAQWAKEIAFLLFASMVVQEVIVSRSVATPFVVVGGLATIGAYTGALYLLRKS